MLHENRIELVRNTNSNIIKRLISWIIKRIKGYDIHDFQQTRLMRNGIFVKTLELSCFSLFRNKT